MANKDIFCSVPWTSLHVYWDGSFGACCSEHTPIYDPEYRDTYCLQKMTVREWFNSAPMKEFRFQILQDTPLPQCVTCYHEDRIGYDGRRNRENYKTVVFANQAFNKSYRQSRWYDRFESAKDFADVAMPVELHVDLGNECNLACKMCNPRASSLIAGLYKKWNLDHEVRKNWVNDSVARENFMKSLAQLKIRRIHFMGGEPTISKRFLEIIQHLIGAGKTDMSISFVTNGTVINSELIDLLKKFESVNVEVSVESMAKTNDYIRQKSNTADIMKTLKWLASLQNDKFQVVLRSVPQLLSVNTYDEYILWAWKNHIAVQGNTLVRPRHLQIKVLPLPIRQGLIEKYEKVKDQLNAERTTNFATMHIGRDVSRLDLQLMRECDAIIQMLNEPEPDNVEELRQELVTWLMRWDQEFSLNALEYYPEYAEFLKEYGYHTV